VPASKALIAQSGDHVTSTSSQSSVTITDSGRCVQLAHT